MIRSTHSTNNRINDGTLKCCSWHKHTNMCKIRAYTNGPNISRLTTHIWPCKNNSFTLLNMNIICNTILDTRMSHLQANQPVFSEPWFLPSLCRGRDNLRPSNNHIKLCQCRRQSFHYRIVASNNFEHTIKNLLLLLTILCLHGY